MPGIKLNQAPYGMRLTFKQIGECLNISVDKATRAYITGINKLKNQPGAFEGLLKCVHASAARDLEPVQCGSVECNRRFIELYGEDSETSNW